MNNAPVSRGLRGRAGGGREGRRESGRVPASIGSRSLGTAILRVPKTVDQKMNFLKKDLTRGRGIELHKVGKRRWTCASRERKVTRFLCAITGRTKSFLFGRKGTGAPQRGHERIEGGKRPEIHRVLVGRSITTHPSAEFGTPERSCDGSGTTQQRYCSLQTGENREGTGRKYLIVATVSKYRGVGWGGGGRGGAL